MNNIIKSIKNILFPQKEITSKKTQQMDLGNIDDNTIHVFRYNDKYGNFDYSKYKEVQIATNIRKIDKSSIDERDIRILSSWLVKHVTPLKYGLCHGTRRGLEQIFFHKYTGASVLGTDISPTATQFPNTIQHDFHEIKDEWIRYFDFVFSNSYDHAYNLELCIKQWMKCIRSQGVCILEHGDNHMDVKESDPIGLDKETLIKLVDYWGRGQFKVIKQLEVTYDAEQITTATFRHKHLTYIIIKNY